MLTRNQKQLAKCMLLFVILPSAVMAVPILLLGLIFSLAGLSTLFIDPLGIIDMVKSLVLSKDIIHITPVAVPFGFWGLYTLWAVWDHISQGKTLIELKVRSVHLGIAAGVVSILSFQNVLHWKMYPLYLPFVAVAGFYWLIFLNEKSD